MAARFNLARIYRKRLSNVVFAKRHYRTFAEHAGKEHPFHHEAMQALKELSAVKAVS